MITIPTVFVLGAGASIEFGFPSGYALTQLLAAPDLEGGRTRVHQQLEAADFARSEVQAFAKELRLSARLSVDAFLEYRTEFLPIGRAAIATALIPFEKRIRLFEERREGASLYQMLWQAMNAKPKSFHHNQVSFVTFNYDRSLEEFFTCAMKNAYGMPEAEARAIVNTIPVAHVHGSIGIHPSQANTPSEMELVREYEPTVNRMNIDKAAKTLKIIHEAQPDSFEFEQAKLYLRNCQRVVFLGFGYDPSNLQRLKVREIPPVVALYGTAFGLTDKESRAIKQAVGREIVLGNAYFDARKFLREIVPMD